MSLNLKKNKYSQIKTERKISVWQIINLKRNSENREHRDNYNVK